MSINEIQMQPLTLQVKDKQHNKNIDLSCKLSTYDNRLDKMIIKNT